VRWESLFGDAISIVTTLVTLILLINIVLAIITMFRERREPSSGPRAARSPSSSRARSR